MSQPISAAATAQTVQAVERARAEVNMLKEMVARHGQTETDSDASAQLRSYMKRITAAESMLLKAETAIRRVKTATRSTARPPPPASEAERASRALTVLTGAGPPARLFAPAAPDAARTPLREDEIPALCKRAAAVAKISIGPLTQTQGRGVGFVCDNVFRAFLWFKDLPERLRPGEKGALVTPEHISVFGVDESGATRWSASKHAVFGVLTERANAAVRYFWARETSAADAFVALAEWLALHRAMFSDQCEERRLAFDASRGFFLPACVRSFDGVGGPRFTRGSIPVRGSSTAPYSRGQSGSGSQANTGGSGAVGSTAGGQGSSAGSRRGS